MGTLPSLISRYNASKNRNGFYHQYKMLVLVMKLLVTKLA